jgi:hypothetical protein
MAFLMLICSEEATDDAGNTGKGISDESLQQAADQPVKQGCGRKSKKKQN